MRDRPEIRRIHGPTGVPADHFRPVRGDRFAAVDHQGRVTALIADGEPLPSFGALAVTAGPTTTDDGDWDGPANEARLSNDDGEKEYRQAFAWVDPDGTPDKKNAYKFIHHEVDSDGKVGAANVKACSSGIGVLNGGRGGTTIPKGDRTGVYKHLAAHLKASGVKEDDLPELDDLSSAEQTEISEFVSGLYGAEPPAAAPEFVERTTPIGSPDQLRAKVAQLRERQAQTPDVERTKVVVASADGEVEIEMAVRWDPEAIDPFRRDDELGAFVSTLPESLTAADGGAQIVDDPGAAWHSYLCIEGVRTDEGMISRELMPESMQFPDLPVTLRLQIHDEGGHWGAVACGRIDTMERVSYPDGTGLAAIMSTGAFGTDEHGQTAQLLVTEQTQRFVSVDLRDMESEIVEIAVAVNVINYDLCDDDDDDSVYDWWLRVTSAVIGGATIVAMPALQQAVIALASTELPTAPLALERAPATGVSVTAGAEERGGHSPTLLDQPPAEWFSNPGFHVGDSRLVRQARGFAACPLTVTEDGRVFGHAAYWGAEHTGRRGTRPPHSPTYAYFMTGVREVDSGDKVAVGQLTMGCGHASIAIEDPSAAKAHYLSPAHYDGGYGAVQIADVVAGEDDFGIWVAGAVRPEVAEDDLRKFKALSLSGDWRTVAGKLHMVACLAVPVPGFPISRKDILVASATPEIIDAYATRWSFDDETKEIRSLVAAGKVQPRPMVDRMAEVELLLDGLLAERRDRLAAEAMAELDKVL